MASDRRQRILLGALLVVLAAVGAYELWPSSPAAVQAAASNRGGRATRTDSPQPGAPDVHVDVLSSEKPKPGSADRDLFKFKPKALPPAPPRPVNQRPGPPAADRNVPPAPPSIPLKFVGYMEAPGGRKIASLTDGRGVLTAREGETVLGQYKIWRIGVESIDISFLDGHGRQTIRMTGQ
jgi:hypothetical protein